LVRPFHIRDLNVIQRLAPLGRSLAFEAAAIDGLNPLREAARGYMTPVIEDTLTLIRRGSDGEDAFALLKLIHPAEKDKYPGCAALMFMAPHPDNQARAEAWANLVEEATRVAGERGAGVMLAEAPDGSREAEVLQATGFIPLIHQDVLKLAQSRDQTDAPRPDGLREQNLKDERDDALVYWLAQKVVPKPIQRTETGMEPNRVLHTPHWGYLLLRDNEPLGHISISQGKRAYGLRVLMRPEAEPLTRAAIEYALAARCRRAARPVYACIPTYESWALPAFDALGFAHVTSTILLARHSTLKVRQPVWNTVVSGAKKISEAK